VDELEASDADVFNLARELMLSRQNVLPRRMTEPGPSAAQLDVLLRLAAAAPDHGQLTPWRFILVPAGQRHRLADAFAQALVDRDPQASTEQVEAARAKAYRGPTLLVAVACLGPRDPDTPALERMVSMGAAIQNILLGAHAMGFGAGLTGGQAMGSPRLHESCGLGEGETAVCCINIGTPVARQMPSRVRPEPSAFLSVLGAPQPDGPA